MIELSVSHIHPLTHVHLLQVGRGGEDQGCVLVSDKEASELEELLALFKLGYGETDQFAAALQVTSEGAS